jgi:dihydropteroate synthase
LDDDYINVIKNWAEKKIISLKELGIIDNQIIFDPGIGFGKTPIQSLNIIKRIADFKYLGKIMVGHSRKSFMSLFSEQPAPNRDIETYVSSCYLAINQVDYIRVHDFIGNKRAINATKILW